MSQETIVHLRSLIAVSAATYAHIEIDPRGMPVVAGTRTKVIEIALDHLAYHWDAEEIHRQHPHLSLGQIHSALAYYFDHREVMDHQIAEEMDEIERLRQQAGPSLASARLKQLGRLP